MAYGFFRQLFGYTRFSLDVDGEDNAQVTDRFLGIIMNELTTDIFDISRPTDGKVLFCCMNRGLAKLKRVEQKYNIPLKTVYCGGVAAWLKRHKDRMGLAVGLAICTILYIISESLVWEIRVGGNVEVPTQEILDNLAQNGFSEGVYYPAIDLESLYHEVLLDDKRISWISVNIKGTVALVEVRESNQLPPKTDYTKPVNLVAARDGRVVRTEILYGGKEVSNGEFVTKGQLLASPFFPSRVSGPVFQSAIGSVYAETQRKLEVTLPKKTYEKFYTGEKCADFVFKILGKSFKVNRIGVIPYDKYDITHENGVAEIFGGIALPVKYTKRVYNEYRTESITHTSEMLRQRAYNEIYALISDELSNAEILELSFDEADSDEAFSLVCNAKVVEDIAVESPIGFEP